jgi:PAS domain S-box-containing protein
VSARIDFLVGLLGVQVGLVDAVCFADLCLEHAGDGPLIAQALAERGSLRPSDRAALEVLALRLLAVTPEEGPGHTSVAPPPPPDRYVYLDEVGKGGMGAVYRARDVHLDRDVALKELLPRWAADESVRARFLVEARTTGQLQHPGVVPVYDLLPGGHGATPRYVMRLVPGRTLREAIHELHERRRAGADVSLARAALLSAFVSLCQTMAYAHSQGVIHRDLKPDNVRLGEFGEVIVLDWGLAKWVGDGPKPAGEEDSHLTVPGQFIGTPNYAPPEQAVGDLDHLDGRSDVYSLGAILYEILTGRPPFVAGSLTQLLRQVQLDQPPPIRLLCPDVPAGLEAICLRAIAKKPEDRYQQARELAQAVQQWQESERLAAEEALRASEERYRTLIEAVPQIVWVARSDGWITYFNHKSHETAGGVWDSDRFLGLGWQSLIHPDDRARHAAAWDRARATNEPFQSEHRLIMPDGSARWHLGRAVPLCDAKGKVEQWFGTTTDVHDLKQAHERLRAQEAETRSILDLIPHVVWTSDPDSGNSFLNRRWFEYTGLSQEESAGGERWARVLHPDDYERTMRVWSGCMASGEPFEIEYRLRNKDGGYRWFHARGVPLRDESGRVVRWFGTCTDIDDQVRARAAKGTA